ncbi:MAG: hypothetical protein ACK4NZ_01475, partial [Tsuneonella sp.]
MPVAGVRNFGSSEKQSARAIGTFEQVIFLSSAIVNRFQMICRGEKVHFAKVMAASAMFVASCSGAESSQADSNPTATMTSQRAQGHPYEILGTRVFDLTDPASQIPYQVFVSLPPSYEQQPQ